MTTLADQPATAAGRTPERLEKRNRRLLVLSAFLAVVVLALGGWLLFDSDGGAEASIPAEIDAVVEDYFNAWNAYDADALRAVTTDGFRIYESEYLTEFTASGPVSLSYDLDWALNRIEVVYPTVEARWTRYGGPVVAGEGPWLAAQVVGSVRVPRPNLPPVEFRGVVMLTIVDEDGTLKVARDIGIRYEVKD